MPAAATPPRRPREFRTRLAESLVSGLLVFSLVFVGTADVPVINGDEARFAQATREMLHRGDMVVPTFGGLDRYDKPILIYWLVAASFEQFGLSPRAARLPSNFAAAFAAALLAWAARRRWGPGSGLLAALLLVASPVFHVQARACTADSVTFLFTMLALLAMERLVDGAAGRRWAAVFWISLALGILTKGPVTPLFIVATAVGLWAFSRRWRRWEAVIAVGLIAVGALGLGPVVLLVPAVASITALFRTPAARRRVATFGWVWGIPLVFAIVLPWATAAWRATDGAFFRVAIGRHIVERSVAALESHGGFPGFYLVTALVLAFPWVATLGIALPSIWRRRSSDPQTLFLLAWLLGPLVVLEVLGTKLVHYWMPAYPAAILLVIGWLWGRQQDRLSPGWLACLLHAAGGILLASAPVIVVMHFGLTDLRPLAAITAAPLILTTVWSAYQLRSRPTTAIIGATAGAAIFLALLFAVFVPRLTTHMIGPRTIDRVLQLKEADQDLILHRLRDEDLLFHLPARLRVSRSRDDLKRQVDGSRVTLIIVRERDVGDVHSALRGVPYDIVDRIEGIDLGRGRRATNLLVSTR